MSDVSIIIILSLVLLYYYTINEGYGGYDGIDYKYSQYGTNLNKKPPIVSQGDRIKYRKNY